MKGNISTEDLVLVELFSGEQALTDTFRSSLSVPDRALSILHGWLRIDHVTVIPKHSEITT